MSYSSQFWRCTIAGEAGAVGLADGSSGAAAEEGSHGGPGAARAAGPKAGSPESCPADLRTQARLPDATTAFSLGSLSTLHLRLRGAGSPTLATLQHRSGCVWLQLTRGPKQSPCCCPSLSQCQRAEEGHLAEAPLFPAWGPARGGPRVRSTPAAPAPESGAVLYPLLCREDAE